MNESNSGNFDVALGLLLTSPEHPPPDSYETVPVPGQEGNEEIVRLGLSQYTFSEGSSACTAIACFAVRSILQSADNDSHAYANATHVTDTIFQGVGSYLRTMGLSAQHLSTDELFSTCEALSGDLDMIGQPIQGLITQDKAFENLIQGALQMEGVRLDQYVGVVITKPPETVACILPPLGQPGPWIFFDSHTRPQLGFDGAYLVRGNSQDTITGRLKTLFEHDLHVDAHVGVMESTYSIFEATVFQLKRSHVVKFNTSQIPAPLTEEAPAPTEDLTQALPPGHSRAPQHGRVQIRLGQSGGVHRARDTSHEEHPLIDSWISANGLNQFGDRPGTMYTGGTPLFDERTALRKDRYQYILERFPHKPWRQVSGPSTVATEDAQAREGK